LVACPTDAVRLTGTESGRSGNTQLMGDQAPGDRSDADVIRQSLSDPEAFAIIFERHAGPVHRYLATRVGRSSVEDLVGETFATGFRSRRDFDLSRPDARPWLFGIATNCARHHWRSEGRRHQRDERAGIHRWTTPDPTDEIVATAWFESRSKLIARALAQIDMTYLEVLLLVAGPGLSYEEISQALDIPIGTVRSRLARARMQLRELLGSSGQYLDGGSQIVTPTVPAEGSP
jgi:RNA polymerase sigma factor (sigma-70 family)